MTKCFSAAMALGCSLMVALTALGWQGSTSVGGVKYWYEADDGTKTASIYLVENLPSGAVAVPSSIAAKNGTYAVTALAENAFLGQGGITKVTIPACVTSIGNDCFKDCEKLATVVFEGRTGDDLDYGAVFENTPFFEKIRLSYNTMSMEQADFCIECQQRGARVDNNQYDNKLAFPYEGDTCQKWYGFAPTASGYILIDTWKSDCDLAISVYSRVGFDGNSQPILQPVTFSTVTAENASGSVYFPVKKDDFFYVCVEGTKSGPRRARGDYTLQWHFGKTPRKVTLNLHDGTLPCGETSFFLPGYASGKVKNSNYSTLGELPTPERAGCTFGGWYLDSGYKTKATATTKIKSATTLHAKWSPKSFNLKVLNDFEKGKTVSITGIPSAAKYKGKKKTFTGTMYVSENYAYARPLTLWATPKEGYGFDRWINVSSGQDASGTTSVTLRKPSATILMLAHDMVYQATYVSKAEDTIEFEDGPDAWYLEDGETEFLIRAQSRTYPTKATYAATKGLLGDVKQNWSYDGTYATMKLTANAKALKKTGVWTYKLTFTTQSGNTATKTITVYGKNGTSAADSSQTAPAKVNGLYTSCHDTPYTNLTVGVKYTADDWAKAGITGNTEDGWYITSITGVPGLTWSKGSRTLTGIPTKAGSFVATITVTRTSGKKSYTDKATALVVVSPLPEWAFGTFKGYTEEPLISSPNANSDYAFGEGSRPVTVSIGSTGKFTVNIDGVKFTGTGLEKAYDSTGELSGYTIHERVSGKGTGKEKNTVTWADDIRLSISPWTSLDHEYSVYGSNGRWKKKGDTRLNAIVYTGKQDFMMKNGEYSDKLSGGGRELVGKIANLLRHGTKDPDAMRLFCLSSGWIQQDEFYDLYEQPNEHRYLRMVDSDTYGLIPDLMIVNRADGVATVIGSVTYNGKKYDMSGTAWVNLIAARPNNLKHVVRSGADWHAVSDDPYPQGYFAVARIMKDGHALEIVWYIDATGHNATGAEPVLEKVEASFWP